MDCSATTLTNKGSTSIERKMSSHDVCRVCESTKDLETILDGKNNGILWMLQSIIPFRIEIDNRLPQYICQECKQKLNEIFLFKWRYGITCEKYRNKCQTDSLKGHNSGKSISQDTFKLAQGGENTIKLETCDSENVKSVVGNQIRDAEEFNDAKLLLSLADTDKKCNRCQKCGKPCDHKLYSEDSIHLLQPHICTGCGDLKTQREPEFSSNVQNDQTCRESSTDLSKQITLNDEAKCLKKHKSNLYIYECDYCVKTFTKLNSLKRHMDFHYPRFHVEVVLHRCNFCDKAFKKKESLNNHITVHTNPDLHTCSICSKTFTTQYYLKIHKAWHLNPDLYKCDICGKSFPKSYGLKRHKATHYSATASTNLENNLIGNEVNVLSCQESAPIASISN